MNDALVLFIIVVVGSTFPWKRVVVDASLLSISTQNTIESGSTYHWILNWNTAGLCGLVLKIENTNSMHNNRSKCYKQIHRERQQKKSSKVNEKERVMSGPNENENEEMVVSGPKQKPCLALQQGRVWSNQEGHVWPKNEGCVRPKQSAEETFYTQEGLDGIDDVSMKEDIAAQQTQMRYHMGEADTKYVEVQQMILEVQALEEKALENEEKIEELVNAYYDGDNSYVNNYDNYDDDNDYEEKGDFNSYYE